MKHLNIHSYCVADLEKQLVPAFWLNSTLSLDSIGGTMNLECSRVFE